jgi:hypothetical protein
MAPLGLIRYSDPDTHKKPANPEGLAATAHSSYSKQQFILFAVLLFYSEERAWKHVFFQHFSVSNGSCFCLFGSLWFSKPSSPSPDICSCAINFVI